MKTKQNSIILAIILAVYLLGLFKACFDDRYSAKEMTAAILFPPYTLIIGGYELSRLTR